MSSADDDLEWLGLGPASAVETVSPFQKRTRADLEKPHLFVLGLLRKPEYFGWAVKALLGKDLLPFQQAVLWELWHRPFPMLVATRGGGKSWLLAVYCLLRMLLCQGSKIVIAGASFRQSKVIYEYMKELYRTAPVYQDLCAGARDNGPRDNIDRCTFRVGESLTIALPVGDGSKIRGQRANILIADEFASQSPEIFENVVSGFAAVSLSPVEKVKAAARRRAQRGRGLVLGEEGPGVPGLDSNQTVLAGTAYYGFNHFCAYWKRYKAIVESRGDRRALEEIFQGEVPERFNWKDFCVMRLPVELLPDGFMDERHVDKARATIATAQYAMEYKATFALDSDGFYRRSLVESCVVGRPRAPVVLPSGPVVFTAALGAQRGRTSVLGVDPASERDNCSIVVEELWPDHRRVVFCWTITRARFKEKLKKNVVSDHDFYVYVARKVRQLLRDFDAGHVAMDKQGGGVAILEALGDPRNAGEGELPVYEVIDDEKEKDTDRLAGLHVIELVNFARGEWVVEANHGLRKDMEDKILLFPELNSAVLGLAMEDDALAGRTVEGDRLYDTLEEVTTEIEELKDELATIVHTQVGPTLRDRWDVPEVKQAGGKKGRLRKDRYSALLMANMAARQRQRRRVGPEPEAHGGFAHLLAGRKPTERRAPLNPAWYHAPQGVLVGRGNRGELPG